jgi:hypothetical protein
MRWTQSCILNSPEHRTLLPIRQASGTRQHCYVHGTAYGSADKSGTSDSHGNKCDEQKNVLSRDGVTTDGVRI